MTIEYEVNPFSKAGEPRPEEGCLERESKFGEWFHPLFPEGPERYKVAAATGVRVIPKSEWQDIIDDRKEKGLSLIDRYVKTILDQDGAGSCSQEEACGATMIMRALGGMDHVKLNPWANYGRILKYRGSGGTSIDSAWRAAREWGYPPMDVWPRSEGWKRKPPQEVWDAASNYKLHEVYDLRGHDEFASALLQGFVVGYGRRNHAILGCQMLDADGTFVSLGSWGNYDGGWTQRGFHLERLRRDVESRYGMFAARSAVFYNPV